MSLESPVHTPPSGSQSDGLPPLVDFEVLRPHFDAVVQALRENDPRVDISLVERAYRTAQEAHAPVEPPTDAPPADDLTALPEPTLSAQLLGFLGLSGLLRRKADEDDPQDPR